MKSTKQQRQANKNHLVKRVTDDYGDEVLVYTKTGTVKNVHTKVRTHR